MKLNLKFPFLNGIIFIALGLIIYFNPNSIIQFISYFLGGLLIALGLYKIASYSIQNKKNGVVNSNELYFGVTAVILGVVIILLSGAVELLFRLSIGLYLLFSGVIKIYNTFNTTDRTSKFYALIVVGLLFIAAGLYTILDSNLVVQLIGIFMTIYGVIEFVSYFVYKDMNFKAVTEKSSIKEAEVEEKEDE